MGGADMLLVEPAWWRAGQIEASRVTSAVKRSAWVIAPAATSS
jgi:hypothetical protein